MRVFSTRHFPFTGRRRYVGWPIIGMETFSGLRRTDFVRMKRITFSLEFWSLPQRTALRLGNGFHLIPERCQKRATAANMAMLSSITARR